MYLSVLSIILPHFLCFVPDKLQKCDSFTANNLAELHLLLQVSSWNSFQLPSVTATQQYMLGDEHLWQHLSRPSFQCSSYILAEKNPYQWIGYECYSIIVSTDPSQRERERLFLCIQPFLFFGHFYFRGTLFFQQNKYNAKNPVLSGTQLYGNTLY